MRGVLKKQILEHLRLKRATPIQARQH